MNFTNRLRRLFGLSPKAEPLSQADAYFEDAKRRAQEHRDWLKEQAEAREAKRKADAQEQEAKRKAEAERTKAVLEAATITPPIPARKEDMGIPAPRISPRITPEMRILQEKYAPSPRAEILARGRPVQHVHETVVIEDTGPSLLEAIMIGSVVESLVDSAPTYVDTSSCSSYDAGSSYDSSPSYDSGSSYDTSSCSSDSF